MPLPLGERASMALAEGVEPSGSSLGGRTPVHRHASRIGRSPRTRTGICPDPKSGGLPITLATVETGAPEGS